MNESVKVPTAVKEATERNQSTDDDSLIINVVYMCTYSLTGILALFGNIIVVYVVFSLPKMRTFVHILLANMAVSDIVCALSFFTGLILCSDAAISNAGNGYCVTNKAIQLLTFQVTSFTMTVIALDRWLSVFSPFRHTEATRRSHRLVKVVSGIWIASVVVIVGTSPSLAYQRYFNSDGMLIKCEVSKVFQIFFKSTLKSERAQLLIANCAHFWIPLTVIIGAYGSITLKVWRRKWGDDLTQSQINLIILQKWKTIKMLIATVAVFILCWLPFFVFNYMAFKSDSSKTRPCNQNILFLVVIWMAFSSCCYNPFVYWIYNETYRNGVVMVLKLFKLFKCSSNNVNYGIQQSSSLQSNSVKSAVTTIYRNE